MDFYLLIFIISIGILGILAIFLYFRKKETELIICSGWDGVIRQRKKVRKKLKYFLFLFRCFLIGRYYCDFKNNYSRKAFHIIGEALRCYIVLCVVLVTAYIIKYFIG